MSPINIVASKNLRSLGKVIKPLSPMNHANPSFADCFYYSSQIRAKENAVGNTTMKIRQTIFFKMVFAVSYISMMYKLYAT